MNNTQRELFQKQLLSVVNEGHMLSRQAEHSDWSNIKYSDLQAFAMKCIAVIERTTSRESVYAREAERISERKQFTGNRCQELLGVVKGLHDDVAAGYLTSATEVIHADTFGGFLERADHLQEEGHKDAAAVVAGSTLEAHLRNLCVKFSVPLEVVGPRGTVPKKADVMNADLCKANAYNGIVQKGVTQWLAIRNDAAHGHYTKYSAEQVKLLIMQIRDFIISNPA